MKLLSDFAKLLSNLSELPHLGFPKLSGFANLPEDMCVEANSLASDFVALVTSHMINTAWDWSFWCDQWPQSFAALLTESMSDRQSLCHQIRKDWMAILTLEKKIFSEIPSNARHAESLLRLTAQSLPDLVPGLNFY